MKILDPNYIYDCRYQILKNSNNEYFLKLIQFYAPDFDYFIQEFKEIVGIEILEWIKEDQDKKALAKINLLFPEEIYSDN